MAEDVMTAEAPVESVAVKSVAKLFRYSAYVHAGEEAEDCPHGVDGRCTDDRHFHAWVRLPNQFQHESIVGKARAARARTQRALRDPESDASTILQAEIDEIMSEANREEMIARLVGVSEISDRLEAMREVEEQEEWSHRQDDVDRLRELEALPEEERPEDELAQLHRENERYAELVAERIEQIQAPRRGALQQRGPEELAEQWREQRIEQEGLQSFSTTYTRYEWFACTMKPCVSGAPQDRVFKELRDLDQAAPEVIDALSDAYSDLERSLQVDRASGNS